jgi:hypothetical protein
MEPLIDPKAYGAFIEYTIKPLIDDSRELLEILEKHDVKLKDVIKGAIWLYVIDAIVRTATTILVVWLICSTSLHFLNTVK